MFKARKITDRSFTSTTKLNKRNIEKEEIRLEIPTEFVIQENKFYEEKFLLKYVKIIYW